MNVTRLSKAEYRTTLIALAFLVIVAWNGFGLVSPPSNIQVASPGLPTSITDIQATVTIKYSQNVSYNANQGGVALAAGVNEAVAQSKDSGVISNVTETTFPISTYCQGGLYLEYRRRRSRLEIYCQIIEQLLTSPSSITEIALRSTTNFTLAKEYIDFLLGKGLITELTVSGRLCYTPTPQGVQFRDRAEAAMRALR